MTTLERLLQAVFGSSKFESSHPHFCPITSYNITKIVDFWTLKPKGKAWKDKIIVGSVN